MRAVRSRRRPAACELFDACHFLPQAASQVSAWLSDDGSKAVLSTDRVYSQLLPSVVDSQMAAPHLPNFLSVSKNALNIFAKYR
jgi:hypothetical protein